MMAAMARSPGPESAQSDDGAAERTVDALLEKFASDNQDDDAWAEHDGTLIRLAERDPDLLARVAAREMERDPAMRAAAAHALGRAAEFADEILLDRIEKLLLARAQTEVERSVMTELAGAIKFVWNRSDDETFAVEYRYASEGNVTLRLAAAMSLALATPVPLPALLVPTLRRLADDEDAAIRTWAEHGLSYETGRPQDEAEE
jgi:hypothetical protein